MTKACYVLAMTTPEWPVSVEAIPAGGPHVSGATLLFRHRGALRVAIVAKATFDVMPERALALRTPDDVNAKDKHLENSAGRSVREASDLAPYKPRVDVTLVGHAHAPGGRAVPTMNVRLAIAGGAASFDRVLTVRGDPDATGAPQPFVKQALVAERAALTKDNPVGTRSPSILDAQSGPSGTERAAIVGPIARGWPSRKGLLKGPAPTTRAPESTPGELTAATRGRPIAVDYADDFDWRYFLAAPPELQVDRVNGDEWLLLEGVHPEHARVRTQLPKARARARVVVVQAGPASAQLVDLVLDTIAIDADRMTASLVFRQSLPLVDETLVERIHVQVALALGDRAIEWPEPAPASTPMSRPAESRPAASRPAEPKPEEKKESAAPKGEVVAEATSDLSAHAAQLAAELAGQALPFGRGRQAPPPQTSPVTARLSAEEANALKQAVALPFAARKPPPTHASGQTQALSPEAARALRDQVLPFASSAPPSAAASGMTAALSADDVSALRAALPFDRAPAPTGTSGGPRSASFEATPFAAAPPPQQPPPQQLAVQHAAVQPPPLHQARVGMGLGVMTASAASPPASAPSSARASGEPIAPPALVSVPVAAPPTKRVVPEGPPEPDLEAPEGSPRHRVIGLLAAGGSLNLLEAGGAPLSKLDFSGRSLQNAQLDNANLRGANLSGCDLSGARLLGADLSRANLERANLTAAELRGAILEGATFAGAKLEGATFEEATGAHAFFEGAKGADATFTKCTLPKANFDGASLPRADFKRAAIEGGSFAKSELEAASFEQATLGGTKFTDAKMKGAALTKARGVGASFESADLTEVDAKRAEFAESSFANANLESATFERADLSGADLRGAKTEGTDFGKAKLEGAKRS